MSRERDLFRAIVISGVALVGNTGCDHETTDTPDGGAVDAAVPNDASVADAAKPGDAAKPNDDAFPAIL